jgi:hypothetical protein
MSTTEDAAGQQGQGHWLGGLREGYADVGDGQLHYVEAGEGPLVVLLHGFPEFWYGWRRQIQPLAAAGFRVVAADMRGYNLSSRPDDVEAYDTAKLAADVRDLIRERGAASAFLVGHDWGGTADLRPAQVPPDPGQGPRSASPATPSALNRPIQRRTVAGWQSSSTAIWAGGKPCRDSSTITARVACRHRPCRLACNCSISIAGPLADTLTGRILITTSPGGWTMWATSIQPPARLMSTPPSCRSHRGLRAELMDRRLGHAAH